MTPYNGPERRRSQRVPYPFEIWYKDRNKGNQGFKYAYGKDLSEHGLLLETYESFPPCTILEIRLELPVSDIDRKSFNVLAEVVRTEEIKRQWLYHIGISFCRIDDDCRGLIKEYIFSQLNEPRTFVKVRGEIPRQELVNIVSIRSSQKN